MTYPDMTFRVPHDPRHPAALYPMDDPPDDDAPAHPDDPLLDAIDPPSAYRPTPAEIAAQCATLRAAYLARKRAAGRRFNDRRGPKVARLSGAGAAVLRGRAGGRGRWDGDDRGLIGVGEGGIC